jgi:hypothetical protein
MGVRRGQQSSRVRNTFLVKMSAGMTNKEYSQQLVIDVRRVGERETDKAANTEVAKQTI